MRVLSVDPGSANVGFGVFAAETLSDLSLLDWGSLKFSSSEKKMNDNMNEVLQKLYLEFSDLINNHNITHLICELVPSFGPMASKTKVSATATALKCLAFQYELWWHEISPRTVKKIMTGNGNAPKSEIQAVVRQKFSNISDSLPPDVYDAIAIGVVGYQRQEWHRPLENKYSTKTWNNNV
jgi:crossover junction endodeoxyribonuclease RuvC